ncbi:MAG: tetratricopeptide repeat protein, partial [Deltaproteobacteria bacterium]|nr:tetratricopeptide repeat protein [Deltaproteobacteria bacterium]
MRNRIRIIGITIAVFVMLCWGSVGTVGAKVLNDFIQEGIKACNAARYDAAIKAWSTGLKLAEQQNDEQGQANFLNNIGLVYSMIGKYEKAISFLKKALAIVRKIGDVEGEGDALLNSGNVYVYLGQYHEALSYYQKALDITGKTGDVRGEGLAIMNIGSIYVYLGQYQKALSSLQKALAIHRKIGNVNDEGKALGNIGNVYWNLGQYQEAIVYHQKALHIHRETGDLKGEGNALGNMGLVYWSLGQNREALSYYKKSLAIITKIGDMNGKGLLLGNVANVYADFGQYEKALSYYQEALTVSRKIEDIAGEGSDLTNIGLVYSNLGQHQKALSYYQKALAINRKIGKVNAEGITLLNIGLVYHGLDQYENALSYENQALEISKRIGDLKGEGHSLTSIGNVYSDLGKYEKAVEYYKKSIAVNSKIGNIKGQAYCLVNIAEVHWKTGEYEKALGFCQDALMIDRKIGNVKGEAYVHHIMGCAMLSSGRSDKAELHLERAIELWESIRGQVKTGTERTGFQSTLPDAYAILAAARLAQSDQQGTFEAVERGRTKSFLDLLGTRGAGARRSKKKTEQIAGIEKQLSGLREKHVNLASAPMGAKTRSVRKAMNQQISVLDKQRLELIGQLHRTDPELGSLTVVDPPNLKEIQTLLPPGMALVEYFHPGKHSVEGKDQDQLWIFVVDTRGLHFKAVDVSKADLEKALEEYAKFVADGSSDPEAGETAGIRLYKWLIQPIEPIAQLTNANTLVIVPWGPMFKIPFAALKSKGGKPLGAKKNIVMAPSAGVYRYIVKKRSSGRKNILAIGNPKTAMTPLPGAEKEAREIAGLFGKSTVRTRSQATEGLIKKDYAGLGRPDVVHLAC